MQWCILPLAWRTSSPSPSTPGAWRFTLVRRSSTANCADQVHYCSPPDLTALEEHHLCSVLIRYCRFLCRRTCDLVVQERGGKDGLWHSKCLEDIWHQQQVQVKGFHSECCCCVDFPSLHSQKIVLSFAFIGRQFKSVYMLESGRLCYYTPLLLHPWSDKGQARIKCP